MAFFTEEKIYLLLFYTIYNYTALIGNNRYLQHRLLFKINYYKKERIRLFLTIKTFDLKVCIANRYICDKYYCYSTIVYNF